MAKLPGWMRLEDGKGKLSPDGKSVVFNVRLRWWHPGLWLELLKAVRKYR